MLFHEGTPKPPFILIILQFTWRCNIDRIDRLTVILDNCQKVKLSICTVGETMFVAKMYNRALTGAKITRQEFNKLHILSNEKTEDNYLALNK